MKLACARAVLYCVYDRNKPFVLFVVATVGCRQCPRERAQTCKTRVRLPPAPFSTLVVTPRQRYMGRFIPQVYHTRTTVYLVRGAA